MISQISTGLEFVGYGLIILGIILVILGICWMSKANESSETIKQESKAIVFIGPIPLVWGYSKRTQGILFIIAIAIFIVWILWVI